MLKDHEYLYAVYQERSFSRAAQKMYISQPALSTKIKRVEEELGARIFDRSVTPLRLTAAGELYIEAVEKISAIEKELKEDLSRMFDARSETLTMGAASFFCSYVLPEISLDFRQSHPDYRLNILEGDPKELSACLLCGSADFVLSVDEMDAALCRRVVWDEEELLLAVPAGLPVNEALRETRLTFHQCANAEEYAALPKTGLSPFRNENFLLLKKGNDLCQRAVKICGEAGFSPKAGMYLDQMLTAYHVAQSGQGITFIRSGMLEHLMPTDRLFFYRIDSAFAVRPVYLYFRGAEPLSDAAQAFLTFAEKRRETSPST